MTTYQSRHHHLAPSTPAHPTIPSPGPSASLQSGTKVQVGKYVVQVEKFLSEGGFAHVYLASLVSPASVEGFSLSQNRFVLKRMAVPDKAGLVEVRKEVNVMKQLRPHKHIVYFIEASASSLPQSPGYEIFILMEWCSGGGIIDLLNSRLQNRLTESEILKIFSDTVEAVAHMHGQNPPLIHRDLKVENILVASSNLYKLCDFGSTTTPLSRPPQTTSEIQALEADLNKHTTLQYRAPEMVDVWSRRGVSEKADIWALGVFLYKLCYYTTPFEEHGPLAIMNVRYQVPSYPVYSNSIKYLIGTMLQEMAQSRPDIWQVHQQTCKLRGIAPYLVKPTRRHSLQSAHANSHQIAQLPVKQPFGNQLDLDGLDSIFKATSPPMVSAKKPETVVPMRRGRPTTKEKTLIDNNQFTPHQVLAVPLPQSAVSKSPGGSPPEEADLFAREAAAGFGDAFLTSPIMFSSQNKAIASVRPNNDGFTLRSNASHSQPVHKSSSTALPYQNSKNPSFVFEDLVPSKKIQPTKTLNEMRNDRVNIGSSLTGSVLTLNKANQLSNSFSGSNLPAEIPEIGQKATLSSNGLMQKTGPQAFPTRVEKPLADKNLNLKQKTGPVLTSVMRLGVKDRPSISDWIQKDQARLVMDDKKVQTQPIDLLTDDCGLVGTFSTPSTFFSKPLDSRPIHSTSICAEAFDSQINQRFPNYVKAATDSLSNTPEISFVNLVKTKLNNPVDEVSISSNSDEEPENPEGQRRYSGQNQSSTKDVGTLSLNQTRFKSTSYSSSTALPSGPAHRFPIQPTQDYAKADNELATIIDKSPSLPSTRETSSEITTEEDEEIKTKRRAVIANFAPPANKMTTQSAADRLERESFSFRARSRSLSPGSQASSSLAVTPLRKHPGPPLRAPKPQSLKSAAAISNLVSRYENLSSSSKTSQSPTHRTTYNLGSGSTLASGKSNVVNLTQRHSTFKPTNYPNSLQNKANVRESTIQSTVHIPKQSLGPRLISHNDPQASQSTHNHNHGDDSDPEEKFGGVNNLKSRWETGAVRHAQLKNRGPRTDYGQS
ncbi:hypothetical protein O181_051866 [Austropuccinia psidii MF-1]|uniref:non-specific serine/threonine protein kinase n=1 Tax=Austropuccinia psidii MF-1 TaxID=1389203 RepID=A0A9Q3E4I8_9BASI|nr:hypothetical protein [Austropuccinia psidii MF-1]